MGISLNQLKNTVIKIKKYVDEKTPDIATSSSVGVVQPDDETITVDSDGVISVVKATDEKFGAVRPDNKIIVFNDDENITVNKATDEKYGVIKYDDEYLVLNDDDCLTIDESQISHFNIKDTGSYSHEDIDSHLNNMEIHSVQAIGRLDMTTSAFNDASLDRLVVDKEGLLSLEYDTASEWYFASGSMVSIEYDTGIDLCEMRYLFYSGKYDSSTDVIKIYVRTGSTPAYDGVHWCAWSLVDLNTGKVYADNNRYFQIRVEMSTSDQSRTPRLSSVMFYFGMDTATVVREGMGSFNSLDARFQSIENNSQVSKEKDNMLVQKRDGLYVYVPNEIYIGNDENDKKYSLWVDLDDIATGTTSNQVDWNETDVNSPIFLKNKPEIPSIEGLASEEYVDDLVEATKITVSSYPNNMIERKLDGIYVAEPTLDLAISSQSGNAIINLEDGLFVPTDAVNVKVSKDKGNNAEIRVDGIYVSSKELYSELDFDRMVNEALLELGGLS